MSKSEDYLDQLLKGISDSDDEETVAEQEANLGEDDIFGDILEELADAGAEIEDAEDALDSEALFGMDESFDSEGSVDFEDTLSLLEETTSSDEDENKESDSADELAALFGDTLEDDIFGDLGDDSFDDEEFLREFEEELGMVDESSDEEDIMSLFDGLGDILSESETETVQDASPADTVDASALLVEAFGTDTADGDTTEVDESTETEDSGISIFDYVDGLADEATEESGAANVEEAEEELDIPSADELQDLFGAVSGASSSEVSDGGFSIENLFADDPIDDEPASMSEMSDTSAEEPQEDQDVLKILEGLDGVDLELDEEPTSSTGGPASDFDALESMLAADGESDDMSLTASAELDAALAESGDSTKENAKDKKKKNKGGEKQGFMAKLGLILFGEDDEEDEEEPKKGKAGKKAKTPAKPATTGGGNSDILAGFGENQAPAAEPAEEKKKEKKKKEKKEKVKKEKAPKPKKEKKPKPPKEPDNTPPLPKKPVMLIFAMVASFVALVLIGANLLGYANQMTAAKDAYAKKNYTEAFASVSGIKMKEEDLALYEKYKIMATVSAEYDAYATLMNAGIYDMALDCLVRTVGRTEKYRADAEVYGCLTEVEAIEAEAIAFLEQEFGVSKEQALEFYSARTRKDYSVLLLNVLKECGLER